MARPWSGWSMSVMSSTGRDGKDPSMMGDRHASLAGTVAFVTGAAMVVDGGQTV